MTDGPMASPELAPMKTLATILLRRNASGDPALSATFVLPRAPSPDERLGPLVERGALALEVELGYPGAPETDRPLLVDDLVVDLVRVPRDEGGSREAVIVASGHATGPFARLAINATVVDADAAALLEALVAGVSGYELRARATVPAPPSDPTRVRVALGALWSSLDAVADETRHVHYADLRNYLPGWRERGVVQIEAGDKGDEAVLAAVLRGARFALSPVGDELEPAGVDHRHLGPAYRLAASSPGDTSVVASEHYGPDGGVVLERSIGLSALVDPAIRHDPSRFVHLVTTAGGQIEAVLPARRIRRSRAPNRVGLHVADGPAVTSLHVMLHPRPSRLELATTAVQYSVPAAAHTAVIADLEIVAPGTGHRPGPLVDTVDAPLWRDRFDDKRAWYIPSFALVRPDPVAPVYDQAPFRFDVEAVQGHGLSGQPGVEATISVTLEASRSPETIRAWEQVGKPRLQLVELSGLAVQLGIPFRDERGDAQMEWVSADDVEQVGSLSDDGGRIVARFRLLDAWARLAYGALSTPDFQAQEALVTVAATLEGWRRVRLAPGVLGANKRWSLSEYSEVADTGGEQGSWAAARTAVATVLQAIHGSPVATASIRPAWQIRPDLVAQLAKVEHEWSRFAISRSVTAFVSCEEFGAAYRERHSDAEWRAIGCRPALQLGQTVYRTYEPIIVKAAANAKVYRSLQRPGRFLVLPSTYAVGRYDHNAGERAYRPTLLLHSTIDADEPTNIRCVLAASLQPDLPPFRREAILAELRRTAHPDPVLEYLPECGVAPEVAWAVPGDTEIDSVATPTGFDVVCTTDPAGFLTLKSLLERSGLRGAATATLPGGVRLSTSLILDLAHVTGPVEAGPVEATPTRDGRLDLTNHSGQRVAVLALAAGGVEVATVGEVLAPGAVINVPHPGGDLTVRPVFEVDGGTEALEEVRAYIEDLQLGLMFMAASDPAESGLAGLEIITRLGDQPDPDPLVLTSDQRQAERSYVLPLTRFLEDPVLEFTVTAVGTDGSRRSGPAIDWPVRKRGVLIPVGPPPA